MAFDAVPVGGNIGRSQIVVADSDGSNPRIVGTGLMPSWSADGKQLACSRYENGSGVWTFDVESGEATLIADRAWGVQWSPNGKFHAYSSLGPGSGSLIVRNVETGQVYEYPYGSVGGWDYNFCWSPDSQRICGVVRLENQQYALMTISLDLPEDQGPRGPAAVRQGEFQIVVATKRDMHRDVAWHPTEPRVVVSLWHEGLQREQLFEFNPDKGTVPVLFEGQTASNNIHPCWSPGGKRLLYVASAPE